MPNPSSTFGLTPMTEDYSFEVPETNLDDSDERRKKRISKSKQWKEFKEFLESRKVLFSKQIPGGTYYNQMTQADAAHYGGIGNAVIEEIESYIRYIEGNF